MNKIVEDVFNKFKPFGEINFSTLNQLINELPGSIYFKDLQGRYIWQNAFADDVLTTVGITKRVPGKTDFDVFPALPRHHHL